jgi:hypothetical protein
MDTENTTGRMAAITKVTSRMESGMDKESGRRYQESATNTKDNMNKTRSKAMAFLPGMQATYTRETMSMTNARAMERCTGSMGATSKANG